MSTVLFDESTHTYSDEIGVVKSVTQILRDCGIGGAYSGVPQHILDAKAAIGTNVHSLTHFYDEDDLDESAIDSKCLPYLNAYIKFRKDTGFVPRLIEERYISELSGMRYGATIDREGDLDGEPTVIDLKCSCDEQRLSWGTQLAGYEAAQYVMDGIHRNIAIVQLKPNGRYKIFEYPLSDYAPIWLAALIVSHAKGQQ